MDANHTPGPWKFGAEEGFCSQIDGADGSVVCCFDEDPKEADFKLMEQAPELLDIVKTIALGLQRGYTPAALLTTGTIMDRIRAAIAATNP